MAHGACDYCGNAIEECNRQGVCFDRAERIVFEMVNGFQPSTLADLARIMDRFDGKVWGELFEAAIHEHAEG